MRFFFCVFTNKKNHLKLCVEMLSIERERLTPQKKEKEEKITHRVFGLAASLLRISDQILTQVQYESVLSSSPTPPPSFYFCCEIRGLSSN